MDDWTSIIVTVLVINDGLTMKIGGQSLEVEVYYKTEEGESEDYTVEGM